jgi:hypothetical protein
LGLEEEQISVKSDFFRIGGDSIRSIRLANRIQRQLELPVRIADIFTYKTIRNLYENFFSGIKKTQTIQNEQGILAGEFPLLPSQKYLFDMMNTNKASVEHFNNHISTYLVEIENADEDILVQSVVKLAEYHDAFRLRYKKNGDSYIQYYSEVIPEIKMHRIAKSSGMREKKINQVVAGWMKSIDIFGNPAVFGIITGLEDKLARIYLLCHHINTDGVSWRIVGDDLKTIYSYLAEHRQGMEKIKPEAILGEKGTSLRQWSQALQVYKKRVKNEISYWEDIEQAALASNRAISGLSCRAMRRRRFDIEKELTGKILGASRRGLGTRIDDILLSALNMGLYKLTGMENHCIMMEGHGRHEIAAELGISRTMGWFALPYPVKLPPVGEDIGETVKRVKETLRRIPNGGIGYRLLCEGYREQYMPKIYVNYQGEFENRLDVGIEMPVVDEIFLYDMELKGHIFNQRLAFVLMSKLPDDAVSNIIGEFKDSLKAAVEYTLRDKVKDMYGHHERSLSMDDSA